MMNTGKEDLIRELTGIVGKDWVITEREYMESYLGDETPEPVRPKAADGLILVKPSSTNEVSRILKFANQKRVPVFPVGGRTGLVGASVPTEPGIILSVERMNKLEIDRENLMVSAEAGATLGDLFKASDEADLFFPPHPGDEAAQIGGLIATNAGGVRAVKYGVMRNYVKGVEAVLPTGEVLNLGGRLIKDNAGYSLLHLIIGSEGTLCVITKAMIKLHPKSKFSATVIVPFNGRHNALQSVQKVLLSGVIPLAIEYVELTEINQSAMHLNEKWPVQVGKAQLIIILTGESEEELLQACEKVSMTCGEGSAGELVLAETREEQDRILRIRSNIYTTLKPQLVDILDVTVPPSRLGDLMDIVDEIAVKHGVHLPVYGHAGDGNLHVHIMNEKGKSSDYVAKVKKEIYNAGVRMGGVITGEHGIGMIRTEELALTTSEKELNLMKGIKKLFDPNNILNPGKVLTLD
jgi:glycolate oxidase